MVHAIYRVTSFAIVGPYTLTVAFSDGTEQRIDFKPILRGKLFGPLLDRAMFDRVALDPEAGTLVWPSGADFDPATLHDWPAVRDELTARAATWPKAASADARDTRDERRDRSTA